MNIHYCEEKTAHYQLFNNEWLFSIVDIVEILTDSPNPRAYWLMLKNHMEHINRLENSQDYSFSTLHITKIIVDSRPKDFTNSNGISIIMNHIPSSKVPLTNNWLNTFE